MTMKEQMKDVRPIARQLVLSGMRDSIQPKDVFGDGSSEESERQETAKKPDWQSKVYNISITFQFEQVSVDGDKHVYSILFNDDANLLATPISTRSKKAIGPTVTIPQKKSKSKKMAMVYRVHESGSATFSHPVGQAALRDVAEVYSFILGQIDDAIQFRLQQQAEQTTGNDTRQRDKGTLAPKDVGRHQTARRGEKIRAQVLPETLPETSPALVETDG